VDTDGNDENNVAAAEPRPPLYQHLPATWSAPTPGVECKMTALNPSHPEYIAVKKNVFKSSESVARIVRVLFFAVLLSVNIYQ